ncbi:ABC transporter substrate-binding protein [Castellaniella sp.]|uniref:ABC transporter substrate-binding protein n=1 Tax=Castellaniella sp. TaxID=1955812 RepID=UPI00355EED97
MNLKLTSALLMGAALAWGGTAHARDLTVVNFGGAGGAAQKAAWFDHYTKDTGKPIIEVAYNGEQAKIKAMVDSNNVVWDLVEGETGSMPQGCESGVYEDIDWASVLDADDFQPGALEYCGVGTWVWGYVMTYNTELTKEAPTSWADFWDVEKFPGKRGMRKTALYNIEPALVADGVPVEDVYKVLSTPEGIDRAFKKLDELKPHIQWWEAGSQPVQLLAAGDVVMSPVYNGRVYDAQKEGYPLQAVWNASLYDYDYWVVPSGSPNKDQAIEFVKYITQPEQQARAASVIPYGPVTKSGLAGVSPEVLAQLPNAPENAKNAIRNNIEFWADHGEELEQRFAAWAAQ